MAKLARLLTNADIQLFVLSSQAILRKCDRAGPLGDAEKRLRDSIRAALAALRECISAEGA